MALTDPIGDMLTMIRNGSTAKKETVEVRNSKFSEEIIKILKREGFVSDYRVIPDNKQGIIRIYLKYREDKTSVITGIKKITKPSLKIYKQKDDIPEVRGGLGIAIISTSKGLLTDKEAREQGVGGEVLCYAW